MKKLVVSMIVAAMYVAWASSAFAVKITHSTAGVLINDGFESNAAGANPAGWTVVEAGAANVQVVEAGFGTPPAPVAYEGTKHLAAVNGSAGAYQSFIGGPYTTGTLTAQFAFYLPETAGQDNIFPTFQDVSNGVGLSKAEHWFGFGDSVFINTFTNPDITAGLGGVYYYPGGGGGAGENTEYNLTAGGSSYTFAMDAWHEATVVYNITDRTVSALTITIDGTTLDPIPVASTIDSGSVTGFQLFNNATTVGTGFVDAIEPVPEPSSAMIFVLGMIGFARFAIRGPRPGHRAIQSQ